MTLSKTIVLILLIGFGADVFAQFNDYGEMLRLSGHAEVTAMGGQVISGDGNNIGLAINNVAQLTYPGAGEVFVSQFFLPAGISMSSAGYSGIISSKRLPFYASVEYLNYGKIDVYDEFEQFLGTQNNVSDLDFKVGANYAIHDRVTVGASIGFLQSSYGDYSANAIHGDIGVLYQKDSLGWRIGLVGSNMGYQLTAFADNRESLPFDLALGFSKRLKHLPFTLHITYHDLHQWDLEFENPYAEDNSFLIGDNSSEELRSTGFVNMFLRHLVIGGELAIGRADTFHLRFGFDINKNQVIAVPNARTLAGLSLGFGLQLKKLTIDYAFTNDQYISSTHHLGISLSLAKEKDNGLLN